ncbi:MAG TPA: Ig-like domain-containing protein, partial [Longimicrobiales bacterium]
MRPVLAVAALAALAMGFLAACTDDDPLRISEGESAAFSVHPQLNRFGASELLPIDLIRLTVVSLPDSVQVMDAVEFTVTPTDPIWNLNVDVPLENGPMDVLVFVELINDSAGSVEWSGVAGPFSLEPGGTASAPTVDMFRGSLANLSITSVAIAGADTTTEGATLVVRASALGAASPEFFWSSLDPTIAELTAASADSASFLPLAPGIARLVVEAGPRADTLEVVVQARVTALALDRQVDTIRALLATTTFGAAALDAREDTVAGVAFTWTSSDSLIARSLGGGVFEARMPGTVTISATTPRAPSLSVTAELTVRQDADTIVAASVADTVVAGESIALSATALDANDQPIAGAALAWTSDDTTIVAIDSAQGGSAHVSGRIAGTTPVRATLDGVSLAIDVTVLPGAATSVVVDPFSVSLASLGASACLDVTVRDVAGNDSDTPVTWTSRDEAVATVDGTGCVTAVANGDAYVVAASGTGSDSAAVHVEQVAATVDVTLTDTQIAAGAETSVSGSAADAGGSAIAGAAFAWSSSDEAVATVASTGVVTALDVGTAWIRGTHGALADSALLTVVAGQPASIMIVSGEGQSGTVGTQLADSLVVLVTDALGNPVASTSVEFATASGSTAPASATTDAQGRAIVYWTLGTTSGSFTASAAIVADTVVFHATADAGAVASVDAEPDSVVLATLGATTQLTATSYDAFGNDCGCSATWSSRDETIATVDAGGVVTAVANGAIWIVADVSGVLDSVHVTVSQAADSVVVALEGSELSSGGSMLASGTAFDASGAPIAGAAFTWESRDTTVATVDADGTVAGRLVGSTWIVGTHGALSDSALVTVVAGAVASVDVEPDTLSFTTLGQTQQLSATNTDSFGNDCGCSPTWSSRDETVATVDASGLVAALANGVTWVVADVAGVLDSVHVTVAQSADSVVVTLEASELSSGGSMLASGTAFDA